MYQVGDIVRVRSDLVVGGVYYDERNQHYDTFVVGMAGHIGKTMTIRKILNRGAGYIYRLAEDGCDARPDGWCWTDEMLEPVCLHVDSEVALGDISELFDESEV